MNTNTLKKFAQEARTKLIEQIGAKLELVLTSDSSLLREKASQVKKLQEEINATSKEQVIEKVAYTWFNRLMALRFMDANDYQPIGILVITPKDGYTLPEILDEAKQGHIPDDLPVNQQHVYDVLDGKIPSTNAQNEAYKELLIGACNHLNMVFPFLFEKLSDYSELLLPDDLISEFSLVQDIRDGMTIEDCQVVEIIGWLYQFYISEKKDEVFASKSKVRKEDIPAATQLFTPRWIVEYMVQNTVGKLWLQNKPNSKLREHMPYFIESPSVEGVDYLKIDSVEEITLLDQACGSGHILVYGFELLAKIYEEEGYNTSEIPQLIIEKNLFGFEIDERASQLAGFALLMKARGYHKRAFRKELKPNILCFEDVVFTEEELMKVLVLTYLDKSSELKYDIKLLENATNFGSLITPHTSTKLLEKGLAEIENQLLKADVFQQNLLDKLQLALEQLHLLCKKHHCIVDNPPYMAAGKMNKILSDFVKTNYSASRADLMACFMEVGLKMILPKGFLGMINQHSWMFLSSYEKLRGKLIRETFFDTLLHLGPRTFPEIGGDIVQNSSFTFWNKELKGKGSYLRLVDFEKSELKRMKTLEAIKNRDCGWFYTASQKDFNKISGSPIGYWLSNRMMKIFSESQTIKDIAEPRAGMQTGDNEKFLRVWNEVDFYKLGVGLSKEEANKSDYKWFPYNKGGAFKKWYGNREYVINWFNDGEDLREDKLYKLSIGKCLPGNSKPHNSQYYFRESITWSFVSGGTFGVRYSPKGSVFDITGSSVFPDTKQVIYLCAFLNSILSFEMLKVLAPTIKTSSGDIKRLPIILNDENKMESVTQLSNIIIELVKLEDNSREFNWDFMQNELIRIKGQVLEETFDLYKQYWKNKFFQLHKNEEELNRQFIDIYGLHEELTPDVPLEDITILKEETDIVNNQLVFDAKEVFAQFMSYAVGCMFGRYSLDKEGLILANRGEALENYLSKVAKLENEVAFLPDNDNIIPLLDDEWFEDDIVNRFNEFLKATFGKANFEKNLAFVEECLGKDVRKYFVNDFYTDHIKRYKKRPIYWMFSSPKGSFNVLIYMHRYTQDTLNQILNGYLKEYREKLNTHIEHLDHIIVSGTSAEQTKASKEKDKLKLVINELLEYERDVLYPLATERVPIDLDDGVLVNYNKFGTAIKKVAGLNDKKAKDKVKGFDWIDTELIR
ncbi:MAG: SAM-dependent methyltransferase [Lutibacter sp.]|nr:MAG: SAM-dependent methyltransferase [Lutibacter sp.]